MNYVNIWYHICQYMNDIYIWYIYHYYAYLIFLCICPQCQRYLKAVQWPWAVLASKQVWPEHQQLIAGVSKYNSFGAFTSKRKKKKTMLLAGTWTFAPRHASKANWTHVQNIPFWHVCNLWEDPRTTEVQIFQLQRQIQKEAWCTNGQNPPHKMMCIFTAGHQTWIWHVNEVKRGKAFLQFRSASDVMLDLLTRIRALLHWLYM